MAVGEGPRVAEDQKIGHVVDRKAQRTLAKSARRAAASKSDKSRTLCDRQLLLADESFELLASALIPELQTLRGDVLLFPIP